MAENEQKEGQIQPAPHAEVVEVKKTRAPRVARPRAPKAPAEDGAAPAPEAAAHHASPAPAPSDILLFGKYSYDVKVNDPSLQRYISLRAIKYPSTFRRFSGYDFSKAELNIVERLANSFMRGGTGKKIGGHVIRTEGRLQGKKIKVMHFIEQAFEKIQAQTSKNPLQVYIDALQNAAPIEYTTRIRYGGMIANIAVDVSASKRLDMALRNIVHATVIGAFSNKRNLVEVLANELVLAARNDVNSYAIKRKNEIERMARSAR